MFSLQVLGAVAQLERALISERTKAGIKGRKAKGKLPGNPGIRERRPEALAKMPRRRRAAYGTRSHPGDEPVAADGAANATGPHLGRHCSRAEAARLDWTPERLRRAVKWLVAEHLADPPARRSPLPACRKIGLMTLVAGIHSDRTRSSRCAKSPPSSSACMSGRRAAAPNGRPLRSRTSSTGPGRSG
jgi:hypothetical protein